MDKPYTAESKLGERTAFYGFAITPHDKNDVEHQTRWIYVGVAGHLSLIMAGDAKEVVLKNVPVGMHPLSVTQVRATGTTATELVGLY